MTWWGTVDHSRLFRRLLEKSDWAWTPQAVSRIPIPQLFSLWRVDATPAGALERAMELGNAYRAGRGLPPIVRAE